MRRARCARWMALLALVLCAIATPREASSDTPRAKTKKTALPPLSGASYDFASPPGPPARAWLGRVHVHPAVARDTQKPRPLVVFLHGLNTELIRYRWMGGGNEGDVRRIAEGLIDSGQTEPFLIAAPSTVAPTAVAVARTMWNAFDLGGFVEATEARLQGIATIDRAKIIVAGHSGGACNERGGVASAARGTPTVYAAVSIDGCMDPPIARELARAPASTNVIVTWQLLSWQKRPIRDFRRAFEQTAAASPADEGVVRALEELRPKAPMPHDAMVAATLERWLPRLLPPAALAP